MPEAFVTGGRGGEGERGREEERRQRGHAGRIRISSYSCLVVAFALSSQEVSCFHHLPSGWAMGGFGACGGLRSKMPLAGRALGLKMKTDSSSSSKRWLNEHVNDKWVKQAQQDGWRSRAAYKILQIQEKDSIFKPGQLVLDLGGGYKLSLDCLSRCWSPRLCSRQLVAGRVEEGEGISTMVHP